MRTTEKIKIKQQQLKLTLFDIITVKRALLLELMATLIVVAWNKTRTVCKTRLYALKMITILTVFESNF